MVSIRALAGKFTRFCLNVWRCFMHSHTLYMGGLPVKGVDIILAQSSCTHNVLLISVTRGT